MVTTDFLNPVLGWAKHINPTLAIIIISLIVAVFLTFIYKWMTNQALMKEYKTKIKDCQKKIKEVGKEDPKRALSMQKEVMSINMKYMAHSFKPTLITFIPIIIIFGWLWANMAYEPIMPGQEFTTTLFFEDSYTGDIEIKTMDGLMVIGDSKLNVNGAQEVTWKLKADNEGMYIMDYYIGGEICSKCSKDVLISNEREYAAVEKEVKENSVKLIKVNNAPLKTLNIFGFSLGWFWTYVLFSLIFSLVLRKALKIH